MADNDREPSLVTPLTVDERLRERVAAAVISQAGIRHSALNEFIRECLSSREVKRGALFAEPALEGASGYVSSGKSPSELEGALLHPRLVEALIGSPGDPYRFDFPAYTHQLEAWRHLLADDPRSVLVSSGTGSGKTECFLIPMLHDLASEVDRSGRLSGVRALMLYPLNALIASQEERLRRWMAPFGSDIRFALYNGLMNDKRKSEADRAEDKCPEQILYRRTLRADPPPVLVTNTTMLEYMTIRKEDQPIVEKSQGLLRWVVIDEAHSYVGSSAAEISLLLRRVLQTFGVKATDVRFVATSATIGGADKKAKADLQRYLADLAGVPLAQVHVVMGSRQAAVLPARSGDKAPVDLEGVGFSSHPAVQDFVREAENAPISMERARQHAARAGVDAVSLIQAVAARRRRPDGEAAPLLPLRVHQFIRALPGLWSCLDPACKGEKPRDWPYGGILFQAEERCPHCDSELYEVVSCRECGEPWLNAYDHGDRLLPARIAPDRDEFAAASAREMDVVDDGEDEATDLQEQRDGQRRLIGVRAVDGLRSIGIDPRDGRVSERRGEGNAVWVGRAFDDGCPRCNAARTANSSGPLWPFRFGAPFLIQNATPTMLEGVAPSPLTGIELPAEGRQLISFTDSRQGTARFAANIETMSERNYVRAFAYHLVQKASAPPCLTSELRAELETKRAAFASLVEKNPIFAPELAKVEAELGGNPDDARVPWTEAVRDLANEPMVKQWIGKVWDQDRDDRFHRDPEALANFLLLRELARRPRRANAVETLGFAKLVFPSLDRLAVTRVPAALTQSGFRIEDWRDFLYFLLDSVVRANFVLDIGANDARWLLPRQAFLRRIVGPGQDKRIPSDIVWPRTRAGGIKSNAVMLLEMTLRLDGSSAEDRATMDDILRTAWDDIRPLLEGAGSTLALDFKKTSLAPVKSGWLCPVTHRVLARLVFGRSPYGLRGNPPGAAERPTLLTFPQLPRTFPAAQADREQLMKFVGSDSAIGALKGDGVWSNLHDRAATFAPYIRAEEHSAQQPPYRLRQFENQFKRGEINLLACSTTMEMGVDIGSIEAVLNTNVPPSIANYRQRVGRAGRRGQSFASSLTFARNSPLDREAFLDPVAYLKSGLRAPQVKLDSSRIVQRHVNALVLAAWFREASGELTRVKAGDFFGFPQGLTLERIDNPPDAKFRAWLSAPSTRSRMLPSVTALTSGTALDGAGNALDVAQEMFASAADSFGRQWQSLRTQAAALDTDARKGIEIQIRRMCREPLLKELTNRSLLPGHGFPTAVVPFITDCAEMANRQRSLQDNEGETTRNRRYDYPSRNADIAIREYAPGAEIVVDGLVWTSAGVTLNWERPAHDNKSPEIQSIRWSWSCKHCGEAGCARTMVESCTACGSAIEPDGRQQFLEPAGFRVDWSAKPHAETDRAEYIETLPARISAREARWEPLLDPALGRGRATAEGLVFHYSLGKSKQGYKICLDCGRAAEAGDTTIIDHDALLPPKGGAGRCAGNDKTYAVTNPLALGHEILTDVAELQPVGLTDPGAAWAFASALREALSRRLGIEPRELGLGVERRIGALGGKTHSIFLFDQSSGGAGYAPRLFDELAATLAAAKKVLECPQDCRRCCSSCVLVADLYAQQEIVDRRGALVFVTALVAAMREPNAEDVTGANCALTRSVADAIERRSRPGGVVAIWAGADLDIAAFAHPLISTMVAAVANAGAEMRVVLPPGMLERLDDAARAGLRNASHRQGFSLWTGEAAKARNDAFLLAMLCIERCVTGFYCRDPLAAAIGADWGTGREHPVVEMPIDTWPAMNPIAPEALERAAKLGGGVKMIVSDPGRSTRQFGSGFVSRVLKEQLEAAGLWQPGQLSALSYSDRYLKAPLPVLLMMRTVAALRDALMDKDEKVSLKIVTEPLQSDSYRGAPSRLHHNWQSDDDRSDVIKHIAQQLGFDCMLDKAHAPHGRKLSIHYVDGSTAIILFDQGFGYWRANSGDRHDFKSSISQQARAMLGASAFVSGSGESYVAVTRI